MLDSAGWVRLGGVRWVVAENVGFGNAESVDMVA